MPDVVGASVADARRMLAEAGFTNVAAHGDRRDTESPSYSDCEVIAQTPGGGSRAEQDTPVSLRYVYVGTDSC